MAPNAARTAIVLTLLLAGFSATQAQRDYRVHSLDLLRMLSENPWVAHRWDRPIDDLGTGLERGLVRPQDDEDKSFDGEFRPGSEKRSAVGTALNYGRRRREQTPALGKATTPYVGVGVLNNVGSFFDSLRDNLEIAYLPQRSAIFPDTPSVVQSPVSDLTTADRLWRRTVVTPGRTIMTQGCCGPDSAGRRIYSNTRRQDYEFYEITLSSDFDTPRQVANMDLPNTFRDARFRNVRKMDPAVGTDSLLSNKDNCYLL